MKVSIASLIYRSPKYADFLYDGLMENTPMLKSGDAEFFFICNNATDEVNEHLEKKDIPHYVFETGPQPIYPANIGYIYRAWNWTVEKAKGEIVVLLNSDMYPCCSNWLEDMLKWYQKDRVLTTRLVESGSVPSTLPHTIVRNFGRNPDEFKKKDFQEFAKSVKENRIEPQGTFMPMMINKETFVNIGGYPEGNTLYNGVQVSGDWYFFNVILKNFGIQHFNVFNVIFYHIQLGEVNESIS